MPRLFTPTMTPMRTFISQLSQIVQKEGLTGWKPADSFPGLKGSTPFEDLIADKPPTFILTDFGHDQQWSLNGPVTSFSNTFAGLQAGLNLQVPAGLSTNLFPPLAALFGDLTLVTFYFNGSVDNTQTDTDPENLTIKLLANLGSSNNKTLTGNSSFNVEFDAGVQAFPVKTEPSPPDTETTTLLKTQMVLRATFRKVVIQAIVPMTGTTLSFSMQGLDDAPVLTLDNVVSLFEPEFLSSNLPENLQKNKNQESLLSSISIQDVGMQLNLPGGNASPEITSISLQAGYSGPPFGFDPYFDLDEFTVIWFVANPFPVAGCKPTISFSGEFELAGGLIDFEGSFAKGSDPSMPQPLQTASAQAEGWVFEIQGGLKDVPDSSDPDKNTNTIQLSALLDKFSSGSVDFSAITIDALGFEARPDAPYYAVNADLKLDWSFTRFKAPVMNGLSFEVTDNNHQISGNIATVISIGQSNFDFKASSPQKENAWVFSAENEAPFDIADLVKAFGLSSYPGYLKNITINKINIEYSAPIGTKQPGAELSGNAFSIVLSVQLPVAGNPMNGNISYTVDANGWDFKGALWIGDPNADQLEFDFEADSTKTQPSDADTTLVAALKMQNSKPFTINDLASAFGAVLPDLPGVLENITLTNVELVYDTGKGSGVLFTADSNAGNLVFALVKNGGDKNVSWKPFFALAFSDNVKMDFTELPVVGDFICKFGKLDITNIQIAAVGKNMEKADVAELNTLFNDANIRNILIPNVPEGSAAEFIFTALLDVGDTQKHIHMVLKSSSGSTSKALPAAAGAPAESDNSPIPVNNTRQAVHKGFGPLQISTFNMGYSCV